jgi:hypothetical protein
MEFAIIWFEASQKWIVVFPDGSTIDNNFGAVGYATAAALEKLNMGEADFDVTSNLGDFIRFEESEDA